MPTCATCGGANVAAGRDTPWRCVSCESTSIDGHTWSKPAEPSGTWQLASTPVCDGGKAVACLLKIVEIVNSNGNQEVVFGDDGGGCALTVRIGNHGCHVHMGAGPRLAAGKPEDSRYVAKMVDELHDYLFSHECSERDKAGPREPIAEPPAPAVGTLSERIRANIPAANGAVLGMKVTGGVLAEMADEVAALEARLAQAERKNEQYEKTLSAAKAEIADIADRIDARAEQLLASESAALEKVAQLEWALEQEVVANERARSRAKELAEVLGLSVQG